MPQKSVSPGLRLRRQWRYIRILFHEFRWILTVSFAVPALAAVLVAWGRHLWYDEALYWTIGLMLLQTPQWGYPEQWYLVVLFFFLPFFGVFIVADGFVRFGLLLLRKETRPREWFAVEAATIENHMVVCGTGKVGYRVIQELRALGETVLVLEKNADNPFIPELRAQGVPVLIEEARFRGSLEVANVAKARAVLALTNDDFANLEIALNARALNPGVRVVVRMFDDQLAEKIQSAFKIPTLSTSRVAGPAFAAAAVGKNVLHSFTLDGQTLHVADLVVAPGSSLIGKSVAALQGEVDITVVLHRNTRRIDLHPNPAIVLAAEDMIVLIGSTEKIVQVERLNGRTGTMVLHRKPAAG